MTLTIATWNVNSVRTRLPHLLGWLAEDKPDIVLLQELKCMDEQFPRMEVEDLGYNIVTHGQKTYNGVAILSKFPLDDVTRGIPGYADESARYIEALATTPIGVMRVASVYVVNGSEIGSDKFTYKMEFLDKLHTHLETLRDYDEMTVIGGDYNIAPTDADVANPPAWEGSVLTHDFVRRALRRMLYLGYSDADEQGHAYTWWDYRAGAFEKNDGLRIDHLLLSPQARDKLAGCHVAAKLRTLEKPSDHAPVIGSFSE